MTKLALRLAVSASALAASLAAASLACADDSAPVATAPADQSVAPVTVTAERRTINLQSAPLAASVISGAQLQANGIEGLDDLQFHTPSLTVTDFGQGNLFNIRGIGKDLTNIQTPSGVVTYWDGVASFPGFFQDAPYYDIANVEILRGPQGAFAGQNATGGAVFITTNDPHLGSFDGDVEGQYGAYNDALVRGYMNLPINDTLALRVAVNGEQRDSFYHVTGPWTTPNGATPGSLKEGSFRVGLLWQPTDAIRVVAKADYNYVDHDGYPADASTNPLSSLFNVTNNADNYAVDKFYRLSLNASYTFGDGVLLRSITAYQFGITTQGVDLDGSDLGTETFTDYGRERVVSEELNLVSPDKGPLRWVAGLYYQSDVVDIPEGGFDIGLPAGGFDINLIYHTPKTTEAVFGQVSYDITSALQVELGGRYTYSTFGLDDLNYIDNDTALGATQHVKTTDGAPTGKLALTYKLDEANTLYAFVAEGHKQNGVNTNPMGAQTVSAPFGPEEATDFEAGWKHTFFDGHMRVQLGGFYTLYRDFQLQFQAPGEAPGFSPIRNASGTTVIYGFEGEAQAVFGQLSFDVGLSYDHSQLGTVAAVDPVSGLPTNLGGRPLPLSPEWTFNIGGQYAFELPNNATLTPRIDYAYAASQWATPYEDTGDLLLARNLVNAELAYAQDRWRITLYGTNVLNLHYVLATNVGLRYAGAPAQYGIRVERSF